MIMFRADGNEIIGSGHIMRCLSIAKAASDAGEECCFVMADRTFEVIVKKAGFSCIFLDTNFNNMQEELDVFPLLLEKEKPYYVVIDSYYITNEYLQKIRTYSPIVYMDDLADSAYPVDVLINYNIYGEKINYAQMYQMQNKEIPKLLLGPEYAPLRKEFRGLKRKKQPKKVKNILVSTGGADNEHVALKLIQYITSYNNCVCYKYHFLIGDMNRDIIKVKKLAEEFPKQIELHQNVKHVKQLMKNCDMAVSAAGSTLYELCACSIPTITYVLADNQILGAKDFEKQGLMLHAGDCRFNENFAEQIMKKVSELADDYELREQMAGRIHALVTGDGAKKIVKELAMFKVSRGQKMDLKNEKGKIDGIN